MRIIGAVVAALAVLMGSAGPAAAWQCPVHLKAADEAIKKAESMNLPPEAKALVADAKRLWAEARKHHIDGNVKIDHANAMWKARAALAEAEAAIVLATP